MEDSNKAGDPKQRSNQTKRISPKYLDNKPEDGLRRPKLSKSKSNEEEDKMRKKEIPDVLPMESVVSRGNPCRWIRNKSKLSLSLKSIGPRSLGSSSSTAGVGVGVVRCSPTFTLATPIKLLPIDNLVGFRFSRLGRCGSPTKALFSIMAPSLRTLVSSTLVCRSTSLFIL